MLFLGIFFIFFSQTFSFPNVTNPTRFQDTPILDHTIQEYTFSTYDRTWEQLLKGFTKAPTKGAYLQVSLLNCASCPDQFLGYLYDCTSYSFNDECRSYDKYELVDTSGYCSFFDSFIFGAELNTEVYAWDGGQRQTEMKITSINPGVGCSVNINIKLWLPANALPIDMMSTIVYASPIAVVVLGSCCFLFLACLCCYFFRNKALSENTDVDHCSKCNHKIHHFNHGPCTEIAKNIHTNCSCSMYCRGGKNLCHKGRICGHRYTVRMNKRTYVRYCNCNTCCCQNCKPSIQCGCNGCKCKNCKNMGSTYGATYSTSCYGCSLCFTLFGIALLAVIMMGILFPSFSNGLYEGFFENFFFLPGISQMLMLLFGSFGFISLVCAIINTCGCYIISGIFKEKYGVPITQVSNPVSIQNSHPSWTEKHCYCGMCSTNATFGPGQGMGERRVNVQPHQNLEPNFVNMNQVELQNNVKNQNPFVPPVQQENANVKYVRNNQYV